ncbi:translation initiation factor IF-2 N-terminal domain-containing protein [Staphylococcus aureus]
MSNHQKLSNDSLGIVANINQSLNQETIELIADDYGVEVEEEVVINEEDLSIYFVSNEKIIQKQLRDQQL